mmetsp:Transcript_13658/g.36681  ORF Transcript_13658/g.36681 Transcript_13658/m.36681 type:complete len:91 (+) Transcript_13658:564-836(+)
MECSTELSLQVIAERLKLLCLTYFEDRIPNKSMEGISHQTHDFVKDSRLVCWSCVLSFGTEENIKFVNIIGIEVISKMPTRQTQASEICC